MFQHGTVDQKRVQSTLHCWYTSTKYAPSSTMPKATFGLAPSKSEKRFNKYTREQIEWRVLFLWQIISIESPQAHYLRKSCFLIYGINTITSSRLDKSTIPDDERLVLSTESALRRSPEVKPTICQNVLACLMKACLVHEGSLVTIRLHFLLCVLFRGLENESFISSTRRKCSFSSGLEEASTS